MSQEKRRSAQAGLETYVSRDVFSKLDASSETCVGIEKEGIVQIAL